MIVQLKSYLEYGCGKSFVNCPIEPSVTVPGAVTNSEIIIAVTRKSIISPKLSVGQNVSGIE